TLEFLLENPECVEYFFADEYDEWIDEQDPSVRETLRADKKRRAVELDKAWGGLHYLLTGRVEGGSAPLAKAVLGFEELGGREMSHGPVRYLRPREVREVWKALAALGIEGAAKRF